MPQENEKRLGKIWCATTNMNMASRSLSRILDETLSDLGITSTQYSILINISRYQPVAQMALADHLEMERTTLYRAVAILERDRLVKVSSAREGVAKNLELTEQGRKLTEKARSRWEKLQTSFTNSFGKKRWDSFLETLEEVRAHYKAVSETK